MNENDPTAIPDSAKPADRPKDGTENVHVFNYLDTPSDAQRLSVGNIHLGAAAFAVLVVNTVAAWIKWRSGVEVPAEVLVPTSTVVGTAVGYVFPSE